MSSTAGPSGARLKASPRLSCMVRGGLATRADLGQARGDRVSALCPAPSTGVAGSYRPEALPDSLVTAGERESGIVMAALDATIHELLPQKKRRMVRRRTQ